jgi:hypothetical protein
MSVRALARPCMFPTLKGQLREMAFWPIQSLEECKEGIENNFRFGRKIADVLRRLLQMRLISFCVFF